MVLKKCAGEVCSVFSVYNLVCMLSRVGIKRQSDTIPHRTALVAIATILL